MSKKTTPAAPKAEQAATAEAPAAKSHQTHVVSRRIGSIVVVGAAGTQAEAEKHADTACVAIRGKKPLLGISARRKGTAVPKAIVRIDKSSTGDRVWFEGEDNGHPWSKCEYA